MDPPWRHCNCESALGSFGFKEGGGRGGFSREGGELSCQSLVTRHTYNYVRLGTLVIRCAGKRRRREPCLAGPGLGGGGVMGLTSVLYCCPPLELRIGKIR